MIILYRVIKFQTDYEKDKSTHSSSSTLDIDHQLFT